MRKFLHIILPLVIGGIIYILFRSDTILLNRIFGLKIIANIDSLNPIAKILIFSFPNALWTYSLTSLLIVIWKGSLKIEAIKWYFVGILFPILIEFGQLAGFIIGTFDYFDLIFIVVAFIFSIYILLFYNPLKS